MKDAHSKHDALQRIADNATESVMLANNKVGDGFIVYLADMLRHEATDQLAHLEEHEDRAETVP